MNIMAIATFGRKTEPCKAEKTLNYDVEGGGTSSCVGTEETVVLHKIDTIITSHDNYKEVYG